jgi:hypothetical protein
VTDRELLELAAKAAGITYHSYVDSELFGRGINIGEVDVPLWNPLTDDGDALRLAVALGIQIHIEGRDESRAVWANEIMLWTDGDALAATRRAIVMAAAEIGRTATETKE